MLLHISNRLFFYAAGYVGIALFTQVVATWSMYFYAPPDGVGRVAYVPISFFGLFLGISRVIDAFTDPLIANWSDHFQSRWGRRIPFIAVGGIPLSACFILLWMPPVEGYSSLNSLYLFLVAGGFFLFMTMVTCPFLALLPEIASPPERITAASLLGTAYVLGLLLGTVGSSLLINRYGFSIMGVVLGLFCLLSFYTPVFAVREKDLPAKTHVPRLRFKDSLFDVLRNDAFRPFIVGQVFFWFAFNLMLMGLPYIITIRMGLPEERTGWALGLALIITLVSFPLLSWLARKAGKKKAFLMVMALSCVVLAALSTIGFWPVPLGKTTQSLVVIALAGIPLAGLFLLPNALIADITDYDAWGSGRRREAMFYALYGMVMKSSIGLSSLFLGQLLHHLGYHHDDPLGVYLIAPLAVVSILLGLLFFRKYPLE